MTRRFAALAAVASLLAVLTPGAAHAAKGMEIAVQDDPVFVDGAYYDREIALTQAAEMGVTRIRVNLTWTGAAGSSAFSTKKPKRVRWQWAKYDSLIDAAARYGMRLQLTLTGPAPAWGTYDRRNGVYGPSAKLFGQFARAAAKHFKGRVDRYAIWNEPNHTGWVQPGEFSAAIYRDIYDAGYKAIKRTDRKAKVLIGELVPYATARAVAPLVFLRDVACASLVSPGNLRRPPRLVSGPCPGLRADGVAVHPYDYKRAPHQPYPEPDSATVGSLGYLTGTLRALQRIRALRTPSGGVPGVYLTEFGYFNSGKYRLPQARRAKYIVEGYRIAQRNKFVRQVTQYTFITPPKGFLGGYFDMSLISLRGVVTPAYTALVRWAKAAAARRQIARRGGAIKLPPAPSS
jgi:hypothetical protein